MIAIMTKVFDLEGLLVLPKIKQPVPEISRRVSRTKTIDGSVAIQDSGISHGDRTFVIIINELHPEIKDRILYLINNYSEVYISTEEGYFEGVLDRFFIKTTGAGSLTILSKDKVA